MTPNEKFFYWEGRKQIIFGGCLVESLFKSSRLATKVFKRWTRQELNEAGSPKLLRIEPIAVCVCAFVTE
ncbi:hypothetical protein E8E14_000418 [Neopestalotiopsis sp. 37M]|nr:hypothetical protein E8E14_000418 [Neopestalotiopsis sp. 37M]